MIREFRIPLWLPAIVMMLVIFAFSATPAENLPDFSWADLLIKKGAHAFGYGLLAIAYFYAFRFSPAKLKLAWFLAFLYAISDEFHQSFVVGRHASWVDVMIDCAGAAIALKILDIRFKTLAKKITTDEQR